MYFIFYCIIAKWTSPLVEGIGGLLNQPVSIAKFTYICKLIYIGDEAHNLKHNVLEQDPS